MLGLLLVAGLVVQVIAGNRGSTPVSATVPLWLMFLAVAGATTLWSLDASTTAAGFVLLASLSGIYALISVSRVDRAILRRTENGLLLGGASVACYGLAQLLVKGAFPAHVSVAAQAPVGRFGYDLLGPDNEAVSLLLPLMVAASRSVTATTLRSRAWYSMLGLLVLAGILLTASRGGILATVVAGITLAAASPRGRVRLAAYTAAGVALGAVAFFLHPLGVAERTVVATSSSGRTAIWRVGLAACPRYCPAGSGWETFPLVYAQTQASVPDAQVLVGQGGSYQPHNVILLVAIELGIPGLVLLFAALGITVVEALRLPARLRGPPLAALLGTLFAAMFLSNLEYKFFWMSLLMVAMSRSLAHAESERPVRRAPASAAL
jgi:O-antigen ligase